MRGLSSSISTASKTLWRRQSSRSASASVVLATLPQCVHQQFATATTRLHNLSSYPIRHSSSTTNDNYSTEQRKADHKHCVELVQTRDMEGYLCGLLMPSSSREAYFALRAFNVEIASIKDASKLIGGRSRSSNSSSSLGVDGLGRDEGLEDNTLASRLRMQWWRDAIADVYEQHTDNKLDKSTSSSSAAAAHDPILLSLTSSRRHNPTLRSLSHAINTHGLTYRFLRRVLEARENDLSITQYEKWRDVAQYGEDTVSNILYLSLETVGVRDDGADMVASDIGVGLGVLTALRSTAFRASQGECSIPLDLATKHDVSMDTLYHAWDSSINNDNNSSGGDSEQLEKANMAKEALRGATVEMVEMASFHLHRARENQGKVPKEGRMCLLPAVCGLKYLDSLKECNYDVLHPALVGGSDDAAAVERRRRLSLMLMLGRTWLTGTF